MGYATFGQVTFLEVGEETIPVFVHKGGIFLQFALNHEFLVSLDVND